MGNLLLGFGSGSIGASLSSESLSVHVVVMMLLVYHLAENDYAHQV